MIDLYGQIYLSYVRRPLFWLSAALFLLFFLMTLTADDAEEWRVFDLVVLLVPTTFLGFCLISQVMEQLSDPRSALLPAGRRPLLVSAVLLMGSVLLGWSLMIAGGAGYPVSGPLAYCMTNVTLMILTSVFYSLILSLLFLVFFLGGLFASGSPDLRALCDLIVAGQSPLLVWSLLAGSAAVLVLTGAWLLRQSMESLDSSIRKSKKFWKVELRQRQGPLHRLGQEEKISDRVFQRVWSRRLDMLKGPVGKGLWQRAKLRRLNHGVYSFRVMIVPMLALFLLFPFVQRLDGEALDLSMGGFLIYFVPYIFLMMMIQNIWPRLGIDLLRPASRNRMVREQGLALLIDLFLIWMTLLVSMACSVIVWMPRYATWQVALILVASSASILVLVFGITTYAGSYRSFVVLLLFIIPVAFLSMIFWEECESAIETIVAGLSASQAVSEIERGLLYSAVALGIGLVVTFFSYRRWCRIDMG